MTTSIEADSKLSDKPLNQVFISYRTQAWTVIAASILMNVLVFGGSLYMLLIYDLILPSGSLPTLLGLFVMLIVIYLFQAIFETVRSQTMTGLARDLHKDLAPKVHFAAVSKPLSEGSQKEGDGQQVVRDLDQVYTYISGSGPVALIDLPWVVVFLLVLAVLHIWLAIAALAGVIVMAIIAWVSSSLTRNRSQDLARVYGLRQARLQAELRLAEPAVALGMRKRLLERSLAAEEDFREVQSGLAQIVSRYGGAGRVFRMFVQSLILTVGALLVIDGEASGGIIIAASVLAGRALAPVDQAITNWRSLNAAKEGWERIVSALGNHAPPLQREVEIETPRTSLSLEDVWVVPPGSKEHVVQAVSLDLSSGMALAVIGPSAAGKTSLARAILNIWRPARGEVRLDGALLNQWDPESLGRSLGYVPQNVELAGGTIGENIARFAADATSEGIIAAARAAGFHESILALSDGYDTQVSNGGHELSAGQRQRIGLARALYGDPFLIVLDEANSNLDSDGDEALAEAILSVRNRGGIVIMITHRPATLTPVTHVAVMKDGKLADFGERDAVLNRTLRQPIKIVERGVA